MIILYIIGIIIYVICIKSIVDYCKKRRIIKKINKQKLYSLDKLDNNDINENKKTLRELIYNYLFKLEESKEITKIEKMIFNLYNRIIPLKYRYIDREIGLKFPLPYWIEKLILIIYDPLFWICILFLIIIIFVLTINQWLFLFINNDNIHLNLLGNYKCKDDDNNITICLIHENDIITNFTEIYNFIISNNEIIKRNLRLSNNNININNYLYQNDYNNNSFIYSKLIDIFYKEEEEKEQERLLILKKFLNLTSIEDFLNKWKVLNEYENSTYCFCPIFLGILDSNIHFYFKEKWIIMLNYTLNFEKNNNKNLYKTEINYPNNKELNYLNKNLTLLKNKQFYNEHYKNSIIEYDEFIFEDLKNNQFEKFNDNYILFKKIKEIKRQIIKFDLFDTACILHCNKLSF